MTEPTSIQVSTDLWQALNRRKRPGDTFEDVIWRELGDDQLEPDPQPRVREDEPVDEPSDPLDELKLPAGVDREDALTAINAAIDYIESQQEATKKDIVRAVMKDHSLKYSYDEAVEKLESPKRYRGAWWRKVVKPGLEASPRIEKPPVGKSEWRYKKA